jgi:hypothetical protein
MSINSREGEGAYTALIWLEMRSSAAITENDDKLAQAIPKFMHLQLTNI